MKRSEINRALKELEAMCAQFRFVLPSRIVDFSLTMLRGLVRLPEGDAPVEEPEQDVFYGKYGSLRRDYLRGHRPMDGDGEQRQALLEKLQ